MTERFCQGCGQKLDPYKKKWCLVCSHAVLLVQHERDYKIHLLAKAMYNALPEEERLERRRKIMEKYLEEDKKINELQELKELKETRELIESISPIILDSPIKKTKDEEKEVENGDKI